MSEERIIRSFEDLDCSKVAREAREFVRQIVGGLPEIESLPHWRRQVFFLMSGRVRKSIANRFLRIRELVLQNHCQWQGL